MTFSTYFSPGVALQGGGGSGGGGAASLPISGNGATITASTPLIDGTQTWNNAAVTFTGAKLNITDTASNAASLLMDLGTGGGSFVSRFKVDKLGNGTFGNNLIVTNATRSDGGFNIQADAILSRRGTGNLRLGAADAAAPVAQTLSVQSVVAGTTNTAGQNFTITGSQGTGTGAGGSLIFQVAPAGSSGSAQNALATALVINPVGHTLPGANNTYDLGTSAIKWRDGFFQGIVAAGACDGTDYLRAGVRVIIADQFRLRAGGDGVGLLRDTADTGFNRLCWGGTTSSFPAIKRSTTFLQARLADDSAFAGFASANMQAATAYTVATLPGTPGTGMIARVTDASAPVIGTTVAGGGAAYALVNYNGANWTVIGV